MIISQWALRHGVRPEALLELEKIFGINERIISSDNNKTESAVQVDIRLAASRKGYHLFRNNVGVLKDISGRPVRYGLANDSSKMNRAVKSGDLIGWRKVLITQDMAGCHIAQFVSLECKRSDWKYKGNDHESAQLAWAQLVASNGGIGKFVTGINDL